MDCEIQFERCRFVPFTFTITFAVERRFRAQRIDHVFSSPRGDIIYAYPDGDHFVRVSTLQVTSIEPDPARGFLIAIACQLHP